MDRFQWGNLTWAAPASLLLWEGRTRQHRLSHMTSPIVRSWDVIVQNFPREDASRIHPRSSHEPFHIDVRQGMNHEASWLPTTDIFQPVQSDTILLQRVSTVPLEPPLPAEPWGQLGCLRGLCKLGFSGTRGSSQCLFQAPQQLHKGKTQALGPCRWEV